jgi:hypothetical protein
MFGFEGENRLNGFRSYRTEFTGLKPGANEKGAGKLRHYFAQPNRVAGVM